MLASFADFSSCWIIAIGMSHFSFADLVACLITSLWFLSWNLWVSSATFKKRDQSSWTWSFGNTFIFLSSLGLPCVQCSIFLDRDLGEEWNLWPRNTPKFPGLSRNQMNCCFKGTCDDHYQHILRLWCFAPWAGKDVFLIICHKLNVIMSFLPVPWLYNLICLNTSSPNYSFIYKWLECVTKEWELILFTS